MSGRPFRPVSNTQLLAHELEVVAAVAARPYSFFGAQVETFEHLQLRVPQRIIEEAVWRARPPPPPPCCTMRPRLLSRCVHSTRSLAPRRLPSHPVIPSLRALRRPLSRGMITKERLGRRLFTHLKVYKGPQHPHEAQQPRDITAEILRNMPNKPKASV